MWRATVLAAGLAVALGGAAGDASAQGNGKGKASDRYERKDDRNDSRGNVARGTTGRATGRAASTGTRGTVARGMPEVLQDSRRDDDRWDDRRRRDDDRRWDDRRRDDRRWDDRDSDSDRYQSKNGKGPAFCRNGNGHPVHGRQWCVQKGFGVGNDRWSRTSWPDVIFGRPSTRGDYRMGGSVLEQILGRAVYGRLQNQAGNYNGGALSGSWLTEPGGPRILQVYAGGRPFAEFVDGNRDGRAEVVYLNLGR